MPDEQDHSRQAVHNEEFVDSLDVDSTPYLDWVVTGTFYTAVHLIESFLAQHNAHPESHRHRCNAMSMITALSPVFKDYRDLYTESERCRYLCRRPNRGHVKTSVLPKLHSIQNTLKGI